MIELINFLELDLQTQLMTRHWRNSKNVTKYFRIKYIDETTHRKWLRSLSDPEPKNIAYIIRYQENAIGVTYFHSIDYNCRSCDWGIYIHEDEFRGKGMGNEALAKCVEIAKCSLGMTEIFLDVLSTNRSAIGLYQKMGFQLIERGEESLRFSKALA